MEDPGCSFCPINLGYALAAETLKAVFWGIEMNIGRNRLFHQFCYHFPTDASCSVPCHWEKVVLWQNTIYSIITMIKKPQPILPEILGVFANLAYHTPTVMHSNNLEEETE